MKLRSRRDRRKREWTRTLADLILPTSPWTVETLLRAYVEQVRGNQLLLTRDTDFVSPGGPNGLWVPMIAFHRDLVWAHPAVTGVQLDHVLMHELGHMVNGDEPEGRDLRDVVRLLQFTHTGGLAQSVLGLRCRADGTSADQREQMAENFGYFAERWVAKTSPTGATLLVSNMRQSLET